ncbi:Peptide chain release factor N(5)-glutamine methyltransferase [hydrothermal vent metagenome]|uniref:peptide chain release factor N(5)-glutamine methyltransferase n=2 Tax=hydrothermal vent metagenome TaxID=652676 RepID=A0A3B0WED1_9ZZZZ
MTMSLNESQDIQTLLQVASHQLTQHGLTDSPRLDAELLLSQALNVSRTYLFTWPEKVPSSEQFKKFPPLLAQRLQGQPIAHILGEREFWGLPLKVTQDTLIPRPDTETLVETTLTLITKEAPKFFPPPYPTLLDLGTGSGAIALALKSEHPQLAITAVDQSTEALKIAQHNADTHQLTIQFLQSNWFSALKRPHIHFDYIVSNPPYIEEQDPHLTQGDVRFEPRSALTSGEDGLDDIRQITQQAGAHLTPQGWLIIEHGYHQADAVAKLFQINGFANIQLQHDLAGQPRVTIGQRL